jgi:hypothetical protein
MPKSHEGTGKVLHLARPDADNIEKVPHGLRSAASSSRTTRRSRARRAARSTRSAPTSGSSSRSSSRSHHGHVHADQRSSGATPPSAPSSSSRSRTRTRAPSRSSSASHVDRQSPAQVRYFHGVVLRDIADQAIMHGLQIRARRSGRNFSRRSSSARRRSRCPRVASLNRALDSSDLSKREYSHLHRAGEAVRHRRRLASTSPMTRWSTPMRSAYEQPVNPVITFGAWARGDRVRLPQRHGHHRFLRRALDPGWHARPRLLRRGAARRPPDRLRFSS